MNSDARETPLELTGALAFSVVQDVLAGNAVEPSRLKEPAFARLLKVMHDDQARTSQLDLAVLIRHALRHHAMQQDDREAARTFVRSGNKWPTAEHWVQVGVDAKPTVDGYWISVQPWRPAWMPNVGVDGVDGTAAQAAERRSLQAIEGDPFLANLHRNYYHSPGQRAAMRAALTTPPGATLLVCLPTGEGKSLIFQIIANYGFGDGESGEGVTLVVTPTVALALDHERAARDLGFPDQPRAYVGGQSNALKNQQIIDRIADGTQGLCFASPEAACGPLRLALIRAARVGRLRALVVDEAHLVDAWGSNFRSEFQILSGVRHDLLGEQSGGPAFRTILLSATITPQAESTLRILFGTDLEGNSGQYGISAAVKLRPEIEYWVAPMSGEDERRKRVREAICHLPRPAILYTTRRADADWWYAELREMGFRRIACVTGETDSTQRQSVIEGWQEGTIDLVIGTSAFGLGIDNPHVRTVIHACIPETLDRFYQEVGRGGRDGCASISLLVPTERDRKTAAGLNKTRTISVDRGFQRWQAMFWHPDRVSNGNTFAVRLDVPPGFDERDIDMLSGRNTDWNTRTLTLMATSGLISLMGADLQSVLTAEANGSLAVGPFGESVESSAPPPSPSGQYQTIRIRDNRHLDLGVWEQLVEPQRAALAEANRQSLRSMLNFLKQTQCVADILAPQYEFSSGQTDPSNDMAGHPQLGAGDVRVARACGGCEYCRVTGREPYSGIPRVTAYPWPPLPAPHDLVDETNRLIIYYPPLTHPAAPTSNSSRTVRRRDQEALVTLIRGRIRNVIVLPGSGLDLVSVQHALPQWPLFRGDHLVVSHLPPGAALVVVPPGTHITRVQLAPRAGDQARIFLLPEGFEDPSRPGIPFRDSYVGKEVAWADMLRMLYL